MEKKTLYKIKIEVKRTTLDYDFVDIHATDFDDAIKQAEELCKSGNLLDTLTLEEGALVDIGTPEVADQTDTEALNYEPEEDEDEVSGREI